MDVAIADVAEPDDFKLRILLPHQAVHVLQKPRHGRHAHGNVVFVRSKLGNSLGNVLAQPPQAFGLRQTLTDCAVHDPALLKTMLEKRHGGFEVFLTTLFKFNQGIKIRGRLERPGKIFFRDDVLQRLLREELKGGERKPVLKGLKHRHGLGHVLNTQNQHSRVLRWCRQRHGQFHHNTEGSLGADKQVAEIITGGVLGQTPIEIQ